jgi:PAS domain S-box-containing protein
MVLSAIVDISARKQLEERFRRVVESAPNAMVMIDRDGLIVMVNTQTERVFGYSREELLGRQSRCSCPNAIAAAIRLYERRSFRLLYRDLWE